MIGSICANSNWSTFKNKCHILNKKSKIKKGKKKEEMEYKLTIISKTKNWFNNSTLNIFVGGCPTNTYLIN